jgi:hypothetical protein
MPRHTPKKRLLAVPARIAWGSRAADLEARNRSNNQHGSNHA